ncbi:RNA polymerase sigma factor [Xanthovirga aplysinae]|uniref:RNA polymerase sigma factor n=1 Tax=Xanthovirga aplysinae TaxID=2529853 RepID=UPI0012BB79A2|nr:RNA polymerase sigma factor [Xanthovirga aplysinae]MTI29707.1 RNA polymerase sigma factor [Xanthovirga aplysinae]
MATIEFGHQLEKTTKSLKPFALKLTNDIDEAKDLMQETVLKAYKNREKFSEGTNLKIWLYTIMKNIFISNYRRMIRRTKNLQNLNIGASSTENIVFISFAVNDIQNVINQLSEVQRVPFMLHFHGFKYHEIAEQLQIPIGTVKNRIHLARKELKIKLRTKEHS